MNITFACNFIKKEAPAKFFSSKFYKISKEKLFYKAHPDDRF